MASEREAKLAGKRDEIMRETLDISNNPRFGYFGYAGPLSIGDNSVWRPAVRKPKEEEEAEPLRNIVIGPPKKGQGIDALFMAMDPLCKDDLYLDPFKRQQRKKLIPVDPEASFRPPGAVTFSINKLGYLYMDEMTGVRDAKEVYAKYKEYEFASNRNVFTTPAKRGGGGVLTAGVTFGFLDPATGEPRPVPAYMEDDYEAARKQKREEMERHRALLQEAPFKNMTSGNSTLYKTFGQDEEVFSEMREDGTFVPRGLKRPPAPPLKGVEHENPFRPSHPAKKGINACIGELPEHIPEREDGGAKRKVISEEEAAKAPFLPSHNSNLMNPMPSVVMNTRNLRTQFPRSFARPRVG